MSPAYLRRTFLRPTEPNARTCGVPTTKGNFSRQSPSTATRSTITDFASRYLLTCEALLTTQENFAFTVFERTFKEFGSRRAFYS